MRWSTDVSDAQSAVYYDTAQQRNSQLIIGTLAPVCYFTITIHQEGTGKHFRVKFFFAFGAKVREVSPHSNFLIWV